MSLFTNIKQSRFGIPHTSIENSNGLIEKLNSNISQTHSLTNDETGLPTSPNAVCYSYDDTGYISIGSEDGEVNIYDTLHNKPLIAWSPHKNAILDLLWVPYVPKIITCSVDRTVIVSDAWRGKSEVSFVGHTNSVRCVDLSRDNPTAFATGGRDGQVMLWDIRYARRECCAFHPINVIDSFKKETTETKHHVKVTSVKFIGDRKLATCADASDVIKVWDTRRTYTNYKRDPLPWRTLHPAFNHAINRGYTCLCADEGCTSLYASEINGVIRRFSLDFSSSCEQGNYYGHEGGSFYIRSCLSPDGKWLLSGSLDGKAHLWDVTKPGDHLYTLECGSSSEILSVAWSPFSIDNLVTCSDGDITFWNMKIVPKSEKDKSYKIKKNEGKVKRTRIQRNVYDMNKLKSTTLDNFFTKRERQPDSFDLSSSHIIETQIDQLNEAGTLSSSMIEGMQHLTVEKPPNSDTINTLSEPIITQQSLTKPKGEKRYLLTNYFQLTGKGMKRKHSEDSTDLVLFDT
ncbi:Protein lethal(2)denticleless [Oopsacas minuta]|uniref:Protein lethal(2)denticleless n=1 Tax=Oopsacas minuta TaxID=111878 RepID=A0AAV7JTQ3_9METZ|nr:Protein lethal(2)denticleless [Oopsacas minuta]